MGSCRECAKQFDLPKRAGARPQFCSPDCKRAYRTRYYRAWTEANRPHVLASMRVRLAEWRSRNPDYWRDRYAADREPKKEARRKWFAENRERAMATAKVYSQNNRELIRSIGRKSRSTRRARMLSAFVEVVDPQVVFDRDGGMCGICRTPVVGDKWHVDHVMPLAKGGEHSYANTQLAHESCNRAKGAKVPAPTVVSTS